MQNFVDARVAAATKTACGTCHTDQDLKVLSRNVGEELIPTEIHRNICDCPTSGKAHRSHNAIAPHPRRRGVRCFHCTGVCVLAQRVLRKDTTVVKVRVGTRGYTGEHAWGGMIAKPQVPPLAPEPIVYKLFPHQFDGAVLTSEKAMKVCDMKRE